MRNFSYLALEVTNVGLEVVSLPYFDGEKVVVIFLGLSTRGILSEKYFRYLLKTMEKMGRQRLEPIRGHAFQAGWKV